MAGAACFSTTSKPHGIEASESPHAFGRAAASTRLGDAQPQALDINSRKQAGTASSAPGYLRRSAPPHSLPESRHVPSLRPVALPALRVSLGLLMLVWGADKFANPAHGARVAEKFYFGFLGARSLMPVLGTLQIALGLLVILGLARRVAYPALTAITALTLLGVWRSVIDPWGWYLEGTNALFFPSLIIFAAAVVLLAHRDDDQLALDVRFGRHAPPRSSE